jgi:hypothetical protein
MTIRATGQVVSGMQADEAGVMRAAAARLLPGSDVALTAAVLDRIEVMSRPGGAGPAAIASESRLSYTKDNGAHFMWMTHAG